MTSGPTSGPGAPGDSPLESTADLLELVRRGDAGARERLVVRYLPVLRRLAHGRLPQGARGLLDTDDLVQNTLIGALSQLDHFEPRHEGAFLAYLRRILVSRILDEIRRVRRTPMVALPDDNLTEPGPSPLEAAIGADTMEAYEAGLANLSVRQREAIILRMEFGLSHEEIANALAFPSANAARMLVSRGLVQLAMVMRDHKGVP